ncbi:hypothetical protein D3C78_1539410 [compost metagenome]
MLTLISWAATRASAMRSICSPWAPAVMATERACRAMWPFWMPWVHRALSAPRFWASPTVTITWASSAAECTRRNLWAIWAIGCSPIEPPTVPTGMGNSSSPTKLPASSWLQVVMER